MSTSVETFTDSDRLVAAAGERLIDVVNAAIAARGRALVVLTGGGNGNRLMRFLAAESARIDWTKVHLFWGDDRYVTEDDDERNEKQAREELLDQSTSRRATCTPCRPLTANSATTSPPPHWPTSRSLPRMPSRASPHRISMFTSSA